MPLTLPQGITVPFPERLEEAYEMSSASEGVLARLRMNLDAARLAAVFRELVPLVPTPGFLVLEAPCHQATEEALRPDGTGPLHNDVFYLDGLEHSAFFDLFDAFEDLLINDGLIQFGFGSHTPPYEEVFVAAYKITTVRAPDTGPYEAVLARYDIPRREKLVTAWDTFTQEFPGEKRRWNRGDFDIFGMIRHLMHGHGLYHAKTVED